jgi:hypothetical protein
MTTEILSPGANLRPRRIGAELLELAGVEQQVAHAQADDEGGRKVAGDEEVAGAHLDLLGAETGVEKRAAHLLEEALGGRLALLFHQHALEERVEGHRAGGAHSPYLDRLRDVVRGGDRGLPRDQSLPDVLPVLTFRDTEHAEEHARR